MPEWAVHTQDGGRQAPSAVRSTAATSSDAQPFAHLSAPNASLYRDVLRTFARAKERFIVHLRPEDVAAELGRESDEQLAQTLEQLVNWGNLRPEPDTSRATTPEDFHRKKFLYQLTAAGHAAEEAIAFYEEAIGRRGALQSVALEDITEQLAALLVLADDSEPDPAKVHRLLLSLAERFTSLADNAQAFMSSLRRAIDFTDGDVEGFLAYKNQLIDYINRFIADLANSGARIATLIADLEERDHHRMLRVAASREALDSVPDAPEPGTEPNGFAQAEAAALESWGNRWRGLRDWFVSGDVGHPSQSRLLRQAAVTAIKQLIDTVGMLNERRSGRSDRTADFRALARWFAEAPDEPAMHRLWRAAFGLSPARHLSVTGATLAEWEEQEPPPSTPWRNAPPIRISPQLRKTGTYERRGRPNRVEDRGAARELLRVQADREAAELATARRRLATGGPVLLSQVGELDTRAFRLFLSLLGDALSTRLPGDTEVKTTTADGSMEIRLSLVQDGSNVPVAIHTEDGVLRGPEHLIEITDLMATA